MSVTTFDRPPSPDYSEPTGNFRTGTYPAVPGGMLGVQIEFKSSVNPGQAAKPQESAHHWTIFPDRDMPASSAPDYLLTREEVTGQGLARAENSRLTHTYDPQQIARARDLGRVLRHSAEPLPVIQPRKHAPSQEIDVFPRIPQQQRRRSEYTPRHYRS